MTYRNKVTNEQSVPITLWIEPWGEDYTLLPQETVEVVGESRSEEFYFHWLVDEGKVVIYAEGDQKATVAVYKDGNQLACGHHRGVNAAPIPMPSSFDP